MNEQEILCFADIQAEEVKWLPLQASLVPPFASFSAFSIWSAGKYEQKENIGRLPLQWPAKRCMIPLQNT